MALSDDVQALADKVTSLERQLAELQATPTEAPSIGGFRSLLMTNPYNPINALSQNVIDLGNVPCAKIYNSGVQTITSGLLTKVVLDELNYDLMNGADIVNSKLTARYAGIYIILAGFVWAANTTGGRTLAAYVSVGGGGDQLINFDDRPATAGSSGSGPTNHLLTIRNLNVGDAISLYVLQDSGTDRTSLTALLGGINPYLAMFLLARGEGKNEPVDVF